MIIRRRVRAYACVRGTKFLGEKECTHSPLHLSGDYSKIVTIIYYTISTN
jgi:hypothetical protein